MSSRARLPIPKGARQLSLPPPNPLPDPADDHLFPSRAFTTLNELDSDSISQDDHHPHTLSADSIKPPQTISPSLYRLFQSRLDSNPYLHLHVTSFNPLSRRVRHPPHICVLQTATTHSPWQPLICLQSPPALTTLHCPPEMLDSTLLRLSFHSLRPSRHLGDATLPLSALISHRPAPVAVRTLSSAVVALTHIRLAPPPLKSPVSTYSLSLTVRTAPSMRRDLRAPTSLRLTRLAAGTAPLPIGAVRLDRKAPHPSTLHVSHQALHFGLDGRREHALRVRLEWVRHARRAWMPDRFVCGGVDLTLAQLDELVKGELRPVAWRDFPAGVVRNRSVLVEDVSFRDAVWCISLTLTR